MQISEHSLQWIRPPQQARTQRTLVALLDAAEALLEEKGFEDMAVAEVAHRAGSSVGAFYRRFKDKDALLHALHERYCEEAFATADTALDPERWAGARIPELLSEVIAFLVEVMRDRRGLALAIYRRALSDARFDERSSRLNRYVVEQLTALLHARRDEIGHPDPRIGVEFALRSVFALLTEHFTVGTSEVELVPLSDEQFAAELTRSCLSYLDVREPDSPA